MQNSVHHLLATEAFPVWAIINFIRRPRLACRPWVLGEELNAVSFRLALRDSNASPENV
jgi:hypothetical protein